MAGYGGASKSEEDKELPMQMVKIKFQDPLQDARGALELAKRFTVICLPEDTYEVPAAALAVLDESQLSYRVLETDRIQEDPVTGVAAGGEMINCARVLEP